MQQPVSIRAAANPALEHATFETVTDTSLIAAASDGYFTDTNRLMNTLGTALIISKSPTAEVRSMVEFSLVTIPASAVITQVTLQIDLTAYQIASGHDWMMLSIFGYAGNGRLAADDAFSGSLVGSHTLTNACQPGALDVKLTPFFVQKALSTGFAGLNLRLSEPVLGAHANYLLLRSAESVNANPRPTLVIDYTTHSPLPDAAVVSKRVPSGNPVAEGAVRLV